MEERMSVVGPYYRADGTRVRRYVRQPIGLRIMKRGSPEQLEEERCFEPLNDGTAAYTRHDRPYTIYLYSARDLTPGNTPPVLSHETLHLVMDEMDEPKASLKMDALLAHGKWPTRSGLPTRKPRR